jgi:hypothetical protein
MVVVVVMVVIPFIGDRDGAWLTDNDQIVSRAHLLSAIFRALVALDAGTLRTPNVHSEIVVSLARSNNVGTPTHAHRYTQIHTHTHTHIL